ncbi:glycosyltransferase family protein [Geomonas azotofigens]|uniref:hypothetical protein n=1 Tax=Geomonas azotofigens TaxID=2843196 RepID=UPI001C0F6D19|nr:hypothetical protein [Geomonas azotofigens]MBU5612953.1 hypothetical protein [Geomonas azotofigens]
MSKLKILYVTSTLRYPFFEKRISALSKYLTPFQVVGFDRKLPYCFGAPKANYISLGEIPSGRYLLRIAYMIKGILRLRTSIEKTEVIYMFGLDMAMMVFASLTLNKYKPLLVYEVHDIREIMIKNHIVSILLRKLERYIVSKCNITTVTSQSYIDNYYNNILGLKDIIFYVLENKLLPEELPKSMMILPSINKPVRIGYFGSIRCSVAWSVLKELVDNSNGDILLYVRGVPQNIETFYTDIENSPYINYDGPYRDPDDLNDIYTKVDLIWAAGFHGKSSYAWARSCRFYNACCFKVPIISQMNTDEGEVVDKLNIGICIDLNNKNTIYQICKITSDDIRSWRHNLINLPVSMYTYTNEHRKLAGQISNLLA